MNNYFILVRKTDDAIFSHFSPNGRAVWVKNEGEPMQIAVYPTLELAQECLHFLHGANREPEVRIKRIKVYADWF